jgi:hypothetical protein
MKTTGFFNKGNFSLGMLAQLFKRSGSFKKSNSSEDLQAEISTDKYKQKVEFLVKQDLLLRYSEEAVEHALKNLTLQISAANTPQLQEVKKSKSEVIEKEPVQVIMEPIRVVKEQDILSEEKRQEVWKVHNRIPKWFRKTHQINSRILIAYLELLGEGNSVPAYKLEAACRSIKTFSNNYTQMKSFGERNHAKVFEETGGLITLWEPVREFIKKEYRHHNKKIKA